MLKILIVEDEEVDFLLTSRLLSKSHSEKLQLEWARTLTEACRTLAESHYHLVLLDLGLPDCQGVTTVEMVQSVSPQTPIIVLSGMSEEKFALQCLESGAQDYIVKGKMEESSMFRIVRYAIERKKFFEQEKIVQELREALSKVRILSGLLPICAACKRIRNDRGYWAEVESYMQEYCEVKFTHGICPDCAANVRSKMKAWK